MVPRVIFGAVLVSMITRCSGLSAPSVEVEPAQEPFLIRLRRELYPVRRKGKIVSHKASYSGLIHVGAPWAQEFRVVFDTGSGHVVLPSIECRSDACLKHRRYDARVSETSEAIMLDGTAVQPRQNRDQVTIGFGTGKITGEFVRERVCLGPAVPEKDANGTERETGPCVDAQVVAAIEMSNRPFELFDFDGILGLGLSSLAVSKNFSFFNMLAGSRQFAHTHFGVFLTDGDDGEESEIAFGGHNTARLMEPLSWVPMAKPEMGYWQVSILAVRVDGVLLDMCGDGSCRGILDSGTSHLGIPSHHNAEVSDLLTRAADPTVEDCRYTAAPVVQIELQDFNLTLYPENYMRKLPLEEDVMADANVGVSPTSYKENSGKEAPETWTEGADDAPAGNLLCTPKLLPVTWPEPIGPNLFILGEPVLHRYYAVFDWDNLRAGFARARHARHARQELPGQPEAHAGEAGVAGTPAVVESQGDELVLMQTAVVVTIVRRL
ncbi:unnamed protein product [Prorocentrum cordatum]|uniref:Peptidase A1 domain-containing protein n=1 Tax=Prorocentrum cordatum TaxID=2364126 RepID=A0ABN9T0K9_9DINO|nr:unnamed protein product [Polarella glacialis]